MLKYLFFVTLILEGCKQEHKPDYQKEYNEIVHEIDNQLVECWVNETERLFDSNNEKILEHKWGYGAPPYHRTEAKLKLLYNKYKNEPIGKRFFSAYEKYNISKCLIYEGRDIQTAIVLYKEYIDEMAALYMEVFPDIYWDLDSFKSYFSFDYERYFILNFIQGNTPLGDTSFIKRNDKTNKIEGFTLYIENNVKTEERLLNNREFMNQIHEKMFYSEFEKLLYKEFGEYATVILSQIKLRYIVYSINDMQIMDEYLLNHPHDADAQYTYAIMLMKDPYHWHAPNRDYQLWQKGKLILQAFE